MKPNSQRIPQDPTGPVLAVSSSTSHDLSWLPPPGPTDSLPACPKQVSALSAPNGPWLFTRAAFLPFKAQLRYLHPTFPPCFLNP